MNGVSTLTSDRSGARSQSRCSTPALVRPMTRQVDSGLMQKRVGRARPAIKKAREYIEAHFAEDVSVSKLARLVSLSPCYFARAFKKETGLPPHAYLESVRLRKAREFIDRGEAIVTTALLVGYSDQSHLTHRFKRFLGITPGQYAMDSNARLFIE